MTTSNRITINHNRLRIQKILNDPIYFERSKTDWYFHTDNPDGKTQVINPTAYEFLRNEHLKTLSKKNKPKNRPKNMPIAVSAKTGNPRRKHEAQHWESLQSQKAFIKADLKDMVNGKFTCLYLAGRGGTGKSWFVQEIMDELCPGGYAYEQGSASPAAFFDVLATHCKRKTINGESEPGHNLHIIVDDISTILKTDTTRDQLLQVLNKQGDMPRKCSYNIHGKKTEIEVEKGLIIISNIVLNPGAKNDEILKAFLTRIRPHTFDPTDDEIWSQVFWIADRRPEGKVAIDVANYLYDVCHDNFVEADKRA